LIQSADFQSSNNCPGTAVAYVEQGFREKGAIRFPVAWIDDELMAQAQDQSRPSVMNMIDSCERSLSQAAVFISSVWPQTDRAAVLTNPPDRALRLSQLLARSDGNRMSGPMSAL
jgi:hypothetical protein